MEPLFASGRVADLLLALLVGEALVLALYRRATGRGVRFGDLAFNLLAGGCLLLALRAALVGAQFHWIAMALTGALAAHVLDLRQRWR